MSQKSDTRTYQFNSKDVTIGGHRFLLTEPDGSDCLNAVGIMMSLIGEPDKLMDDIRAAVAEEEEGGPLARLNSIGFKMSLGKGRFQHVPKTDVVELLAITTDKDHAWYDEHRLSGPDLMELLAEVASILPFAGVLPQKGMIAAYLVRTFTESSETPEPSSGNGTDGDQTTSPDAESDGSYIKPAPAPTEESAPN